jgi:hypothetical protein
MDNPLETEVKTEALEIESVGKEDVAPIPEELEVDTETPIKQEVESSGMPVLEATKARMHATLSKQVPIPVASKGFSPDTELTVDICEIILRRQFDAELEDLPSGCVAGDALTKVRLCLDELACTVGPALASPSSTPPSEDTYTSVSWAPGSGATSVSGSGCSPTGGQGDIGASSNSTHGQSLKRGSQEFEGGTGGEDSGNGGWDSKSGGSNDPAVTISSPPGGKRLKQDTSAGYSCPFRKRNPLKFNVRDHIHCATTCFSDISQLK